jgi:hypothetical protein
MAAGCRDGIQQKLTQLISKLMQLSTAQRSNIGRCIDGFQQSAH